MHLAAVLRHRPPRDTDAMIKQAVADLGIAESAASSSFLTDDLLDDVFDAERRCKQITHRDHLPGREHHELSCHRAATGRFVHAERIRHFAAGEDITLGWQLADCQALDPVSFAGASQ